MIKILQVCIFIALLTMLASAYGDETEFSGVSHGTKVMVKTVCLDGFKFAAAVVGEDYANMTGVSLVQVFEKYGSNSVPVYCGEGETIETMKEVKYER